MKYIKTYEESISFWGTVGSGILPIAKSTGRILMPLRSPYVMEPNTWGTWGGKLDDMETNDPKEAAKQEFLEESGYSGEIELIPAYVFKNKNSSGKVTFIYHNYIGLLKEEFEPELDWETQDYKWVSYAELIQLKPKHFGLVGLIKNSGDIIRRYAK